jgi:hypothetical protein
MMVNLLSVSLLENLIRAHCSIAVRLHVGGVMGLELWESGQSAINSVQALLPVIGLYLLLPAGSPRALSMSPLTCGVGDQTPLGRWA